MSATFFVSILDEETEEIKEETVSTDEEMPDVESKCRQKFPLWLFEFHFLESSALVNFERKV